MAFLNAKKVAAPTATKASGKIKPVDLIPGFAEVAALTACIKSLQGLLEIKKQEVVDAATERLLARGVKAKRKPDSMEVADRGATGTCYLTKRSSRSPLTADEIDTLGKFFAYEQDAEKNITGILGYTTKNITQPSMLAFNPAYADRQDILTEMDKKLSQIKGLPEDIIIQTPELSQIVVADSAFDNLFTQPSNVVDEVFPILGIVATRPVFKDLSQAWELVSGMLAEEPLAEAAE